jgi:DNA polymerase-3 subunit epsilon
MFNRWRYRRRCSAIARICERPDVAAYISECADLSVDELVNTPLISVDLEMTGLDAKQNQIIAIGWTQLDRGRIHFDTSRHMLVNAEQSVGHSAAVHELMDKDVAGGVPLDAGLEALFEAAKGRVWLFHHAGLDVSFLQKACLDWVGVAMPFMVIDTLLLELALRKRRNLPIHHGDLQLGKLRAKYNLPGYTAHNALIDACATAELLLAIAENMETAGSLGLRNYLVYY